MGRVVDLNKPLSHEDRDYLTSRGRGYLIAANERRFGTPDNPREPEPHEATDAPSVSPFYDTQERNRAVYDRGGAPLPGTTLDYDTGRAYDRDNGILVEPNMPVTAPGHFATKFRMEPEQFTSYGDEGDADIDDDIAQEVTSLNVRELESRLKEEGLEVPSHEDVSDLKVEDLKEKLVEAEVGWEAEDRKPELQKKLSAALNKKRKESMQDKLAIHLQDKRDGR